MTIKVTPSVTASVVISSATWQFGTTAVGSTSTLTGLTVTNNGEVNAEWKQWGGDLTDGTYTWDLLSTGDAGLDQYGFAVKVQGSSYGRTPDTEAGATTIPGADNVAAGTSKDLDVQLYMPTSISGGSGNEFTGTYNIKAIAK